MPNVSTYRFRDEVALCVSGVGGETVYLTAADALALATAIRKAGLSCKKEKFTESNVGTVPVAARKLNDPR